MEETGPYVGTGREQQAGLTTRLIEAAHRLEAREILTSTVATQILVQKAECAVKGD
jgi:hypothetical protein